MVIPLREAMLQQNYLCFRNFTYLAHYDTIPSKGAVSMKKSSNPSAVYDIVKTIAVLLVVFAHSTRMYTSYGVVSPVNQSLLLAKLTEYIYSFHMPLFIFVSGAVYGLCIQRGKYTDKLEFVKNKAKRLIIPYAFFGLLYVAPVMCLFDFTDEGYLEYCLNGIILSMNSRHLWFLAALFLIFLFSIFYRKWLLESDKARLFSLILSCIIFAVAAYVPSQFQVRAAFSYQLFFVAGACMHFYYEKIVSITMKMKFLWILLPVVLAGRFLFNPNTVTNLSYQFCGIFMVISAAVILENWLNLHNTKWFRVMKENSMGIFLFHPMIIYVGFFWLAPKDIEPIILSIAIALLSILLAVILTKIMRKLRLGFLMGE